MTHTLIIGIDPGITGAIAALADMRCVGCYDMPRARRRAKGEQVNAVELAGLLRDLLAEHPGAYAMFAVEEVASRPGQGVASMFRFGESAGVVRGVVATLGAPATWVAPQSWRRACGLSGAAKDASVGRAVELHPEARHWLARKRDGGRAEALLIARHVWLEQIGFARAA